MTKAIPEINPDLCAGCGDCVELCPTGAVALIDGKATVISPDACNYCAECEAVCPDEAIRCPFAIILMEEQPAGDESNKK